MTMHIRYDHQCPKCSAKYIPYHQEIPCPRCGLVEQERFDFIPEVARSAPINLSEKGSYAPAVWASASLGEHIQLLLFLVLEVHRTNATEPFSKVAHELFNVPEFWEEYWDKDWGDPIYLGVGMCPLFHSYYTIPPFTIYLQPSDA